MVTYFISLFNFIYLSTYIRDIQYAYKSLVRKHSIKSHLQDTGTDKIVTLRPILEMYGVIFGLGYFCLE